jgi:hypothetical protein
MPEDYGATGRPDPKRLREGNMLCAVSAKRG